MAKSDEVFKRIEARMAKIDPANRQVEHVFKFIMLDDADGSTVVKTWIVDLVAVKLYEGTDEAECTLKMKESTLLDIFNGVMDATQALNADLIDVEGNIELIAKLKPLISQV